MTKTVTRVETDRFGPIDVEADCLFAFPVPLPGFEGTPRFALLRLETSRPLFWLHSTEGSEVCLAVVDPWDYFPDYQPNFDPKSLQELDVGDDDEIAIYCVVAPHREGLCVNLAAPIVLFPRLGLGQQLILNEGDLMVAVPLEDSKC